MSAGLPENIGADDPGHLDHHETVHRWVNALDGLANGQVPVRDTDGTVVGGTAATEEYVDEQVDNATQGMGARILQTSSQSIGNATTVTISMDTVMFDEGGYADLSGNRIVIPSGGRGIYQVSAGVRISSGSSGIVQTRVDVGSSAVLMDTREASGGNLPVGVSGSLLLEPGDILTCRVFQNSGGSVSTDTGFSASWLSVAKLGPV